MDMPSRTCIHTGQGSPSMSSIPEIRWAVGMSDKEDLQIAPNLLVLGKQWWEERRKADIEVVTVQTSNFNLDAAEWPGLITLALVIGVIGVIGVMGTNSDKTVKLVDDVYSTQMLTANIHIVIISSPSTMSPPHPLEPKLKINLRLVS